MQLGLSTHCVGESPLRADHVAALAEAGTRLIEIGSGQEFIRREGRSGVRAIKDALRKGGVSVFSVHSPHGIVPLHGDLGALSEVTRKKGINTMRRSAEVCAALGGEVVSIHPGEWFFCWDEKADHIDAVKRSIAEAAEICEARGLRLAVETMRPAEPRIGDDYRDLLALMEDFSPDAVGLCLDTNHANLRWDLAQVVRDAGPRLMTLHISDNDGKEERHWLPFEGVIDWPAFCEALVEVDYQGPLMYEVGTDETPLAEVVAGVLANYERLISLIDKARAARGEARNTQREES